MSLSLVCFPGLDMAGLVRGLGHGNLVCFLSSDVAGFVRGLGHGEG